MVAVFEVDHDFRVVILAANVKLAPPTASARSRGPRPPPGAAVQRLEEITEAAQIRSAAAEIPELKAGIPAWRWVEVLARFPLRPKLVIGGAFLRIFQYLVGFTQFLELCLCFRFLADIRVELTCQLAVGALDLVLGGVTLDAHDVVVIFEFHDLILTLRG